MQASAGRSPRNGPLFSFMLASLALVWAINFFVVLPIVNPGFAHLLPYAVTLASKLAFGVAAAAALRARAPTNVARLAHRSLRAGSSVSPAGVPLPSLRLQR
jgi:hypothetical protein